MLSRQDRQGRKGKNFLFVCPKPWLALRLCARHVFPISCWIKNFKYLWLDFGSDSEARDPERKRARMSVFTSVMKSQGEKLPLLTSCAKNVSGKGGRESSLTVVVPEEQSSGPFTVFLTTLLIAD